MLYVYFHNIDFQGGYPARNRKRGICKGTSKTGTNERGESITSERRRRKKKSKHCIMKVYISERR